MGEICRSVKSEIKDWMRTRVTNIVVFCIELANSLCFIPEENSFLSPCSCIVKLASPEFQWCINDIIQRVAKLDGLFFSRK